MALNDANIRILQFDETAAACLNHPQGDKPSLCIVHEGALTALLQAPGMIDGPCHTILPRHEATLRILNLPTQNADEIASMVALSASEWVPYPIEEMLLTHQCLAHLPSGESRVLVVLVRNATLDAHLAALNAEGLEPAQIYLSTACLVAATSTMNLSGDIAVHDEGQPAPSFPRTRESRTRRGLPKTTLDPRVRGDDESLLCSNGERLRGDIALLHVDPAALELAVVRDGELRFSRGIAQNTPWNLDDPHSKEALGYEVRDLLAAYRRESEDGQGADVLYVSATGFPAADIAQFLAEITGKDCRVADTGTTLPPDGEAMPATFAGAMHLIRGEGTLDIPLAPHSLAQDRAMKSLQSQLLRSAALVGVVLFSLLLWFGQAVWQRNALIVELQDKIDVVAPSAQGVAAKQHSLQLIARQVDRGGSFLEILAGISAAAPPADLTITRIQFERESGLTLWGRAMTKDLVLKDFLGAMRNHAEGNLALFSQAHSLYETAGIERNQSIFNYQISIPLPEEDADDDAASHR